MEGFEWHLCTCCLNESKVATLHKILVKRSRVVLGRQDSKNGNDESALLSQEFVVQSDNSIRQNVVVV